MSEITREMVAERLVELRQAQLEALSQSSALLGRIQECELLLLVLDKREEEEEEVVLEGETSPPPPKLVEDS